MTPNIDWTRASILYLNLNLTQAQVEPQHVKKISDKKQ